MRINEYSIYKKTFKNIFRISASSLGSAIFSFFLLIIISDKLTLKDYGTFTYLLSLVSIFLPIACFGLPQLWIKSYGEIGEISKVFFLDSLKYILIILPIIICFLFLWSKFNQFNRSEVLLLSILFIIIISQIFFELCCAIYQINESYIKLTIIQICQNFLRLLFIISFLLYFQSLNIYTVSLSYFLSAILIILFGIIELKNFLYKKKINYDDNKFLKKNTLTLVNTLPFAFINFMGMLYLSINIILLDLIGSKEEIAYFGVALNIFLVFLILPNSIYSKLYLKKFHYWSNHDLIKLKKYFIIGILSMFFIGVLFAILINLFSEFFIISIFDEKFRPSIKILNTLSLALPILFAGYNAGTILLTKNYIYKKIVNVSIATILTPVFSYFLFFEFGVIGITISIVLCSIILFLLNIFTLIRNEKHLQFY